MKIKLIDCEEYERVEQFGTCDLCMHMGTAEYRTFTFENVATGELFDVEAQEWDCGDFSGLKTSITWHASLSGCSTTRLTSLNLTRNTGGFVRLSTPITATLMALSDSCWMGGA